jgi:hypothetical protein
MSYEGQKCLLTIKTRYATRANSNVGKIVAKLTAGPQRSVVVDQAKSIGANHQAAAAKLAGDYGLVLGCAEVTEQGYEYELYYPERG